MELTQAYQTLYDRRAALAAHIEAAEAETKRLTALVTEASTTIRMDAAGLDQELIALARTVISVYGEFDKAGDDRGSARADAIRQLVTGQPLGPYKDLWTRFFGTKSYDRWHGQRSDHEYGFGPSHGSTIFRIGLLGDVRQRDPRELTDAERDAAVYYLTNLERIQEAERTGRAA